MIRFECRITLCHCAITLQTIASSTTSYWALLNTIYNSISHLTTRRSPSSANKRAKKSKKLQQSVKCAFSSRAQTTTYSKSFDYPRALIFVQTASHTKLTSRSLWLHTNSLLFNVAHRGAFEVLFKLQLMNLQRIMTSRIVVIRSLINFRTNSNTVIYFPELS